MNVRINCPGCGRPALVNVERPGAGHKGPEAAWNFRGVRSHDVTVRRNCLGEGCPFASRTHSVTLTVSVNMDGEPKEQVSLNLSPSLARAASGLSIWAQQEARAVVVACAAALDGDPTTEGEEAEVFWSAVVDGLKKGGQQ
jgi:hypothetical protein